MRNQANKFGRKRSNESGSLSDRDLWGFELGERIESGFSEDDLQMICEPFAGGLDLRLPRAVTVVSDWKVEHYSFGRLYRDWLNLPPWLPLGFSGDHGWVNRTELTKFEEESPLRLHLTFWDEKAKANREHERKTVITVPHPWVTYRKRHGYAIAVEAYGSVVFLPHESEVARWEPYDYADYVKRIRSETSFPTPRAICLHGEDIRLRNRQTLVQDLGLPIVTAGNPSSQYFVDRFYSLMTNFRGAASFSPGSEMLYLTELGLDYWATDADPPRLRTSDRTVYTSGIIRQVKGSRAAEIDLEVLRLFNDRKTLPEQKVAFCAQFLGLTVDEEKARHEARSAVYSQFVRRPDLFALAYLRSLWTAIRHLKKLAQILRRARWLNRS